MKIYQEMTKKQLLGLAVQPEFSKPSLRVLEGEGFSGYETASNGATIVASREENADRYFNGVLGYAIEPRIREVVGATHKDMQAALEADFYIINNVNEVFVKCTGKHLAAILKEAVKRNAGSTDTPLKEQVGFFDVKELTLKPITEYSENTKFQRYIADMKIKRDQGGIDLVLELLATRKFSIEKLFEFSRQIANARYYNIPSDILKTFASETTEKRFKAAFNPSDTSGGFF